MLCSKGNCAATTSTRSWHLSQDAEKLSGCLATVWRVYQFPPTGMARPKIAGKTMSESRTKHVTDHASAGRKQEMEMKRTERKLRTKGPVISHRTPSRDLRRLPTHEHGSQMRKGWKRQAFNKEITQLVVSIHLDELNMTCSDMLAKPMVLDSITPRS
mgnify:CR=1 FL=1